MCHQTVKRLMLPDFSVFSKWVRLMVRLMPPDFSVFSKWVREPD